MGNEKFICLEAKVSGEVALGAEGTFTINEHDLLIGGSWSASPLTVGATINAKLLTNTEFELYKVKPEDELKVGSGAGGGISGTVCTF